MHRHPFAGRILRSVTHILAAILLVAGVGLAFVGGSTVAGAHPTSADDNHHPSGKDKSTEAGGSGTQGDSASDPDGASNGGADKPGGAGGEHPDDQDGNNGCGNDDDFEDDNNGRCLGRQHAESRGGPEGVERSSQGAVVKGAEEERDTDHAASKNEADVGAASENEADVVAADSLERRAVAATSRPGARVLGAELEKGALSAHVLGAEMERSGDEGAQVLGVSLARTGSELLVLAALAAALVLLGSAAKLLARRRSFNS